MPFASHLRITSVVTLEDAIEAKVNLSIGHYTSIFNSLTTLSAFLLHHVITFAIATQIFV